MRVREGIGRLVGDGVGRDLVRLVSGTLAGRVIAVAAMPMITRLYSPADFALLATYLSLVSLVSVAACLRLDVAIPVAKADEDAAHLLVLALLVAGTVSLLALGLAMAVPGEVAALLGQPDIAPWLWLVPVGVLLASSYSTLQWWATRARRFGSIAITRVTQALFGSATSVALGVAGVAPLGLLLGNVLNASAGSLRLLVDLRRQDVSAFTRLSPAGLLATLGRYRRFPIFSTPEALINVAGLQLPILLIAAFLGHEAGFLLLAQQVMALPMSLLGSSISQVYMSRAPEKLANGQLAEFTLETLSRLAAIALGPVVLLALVAPFVFTVIFGSDWTRSGQIMLWMAPWMALQFIASPISTVLLVTNRQPTLLLLTTIGLVLRAGLVAIGLALGGDYPVIGLVVGSTGYYFVFLVVSSRVAGFEAGHYRRLARAVFLSRSSLLIVPICLAYAVSYLWRPA
jgi:O-antigen/teichoic acid export membrane protein